MKYLSIVFVAAIALVSCGGEVDACECYAAMTEAGEEAWAADSAANADCNAAMAVEGALDSCEVASSEEASSEEAPAEEAAAEEAPAEEAAAEEAPAEEVVAEEAPAEEVVAEEAAE